MGNLKKKWVLSGRSVKSYQKTRSHTRQGNYLQTSICRAAKAGSFMFSVNIRFKRNNLSIVSQSVHFVVVRMLGFHSTRKDVEHVGTGMSVKSKKN